MKRRASKREGALTSPDSFNLEGKSVSEWLDPEENVVGVVGKRSARGRCLADAHLEKWEVLFAGLLLTIGGVLAFALFAVLTNLVSTREELWFNQLAHLELNSASVALNDYIVAVSVMHRVALLGGGPNLDVNEFDIHAKNLLKRFDTMFLHVSYLPGTNASDRALVESRTAQVFNAQLGLNASYPVRNVGPDGEELFVAPSNETEMFAVHHVQPLNEDTKHLGNLNLASLDKTLGPRLKYVLDAQKAIIVSPFNLPGFGFDPATHPVCFAFICKTGPTSMLITLGSFNKMVARAIAEVQGGTELHGYVDGEPVGSFTATRTDHKLTPLEEALSRPNVKQGPARTLMNVTFDFVVTMEEGQNLDVENQLYYGLVAVVAVSFLFTTLFFVFRAVSNHRHSASKQLTLRNNAKRIAASERNLQDFLAHEVRNPLFVAISASSFIKSSLTVASWPDAEVQQSTREDCELIRHSLQYVQQLLNNMLDLNKYSNGERIPLRPAPVSLNHDVLQAVALMLRRNSNSYSVDVEIGGEGGGDGDLWVNADVLRLKQVLLNLGTNATKFVQHGFVRFVGKRLDADRVVLAVEDSGPGVPADLRSSLFSKYGCSPDMMRQGTGIGLALCELIVESMGGTIRLDEDWVSGVEGCPGTRIEVVLPLARLDLSGLAAGEQEQHKSSFQGRDVHSVTFDADKVSVVPRERPWTKAPLTCLVVDDDALVRVTLKRYLTKVFPGVTVSESPTGEHALTLLEKGCEFDVIFMDHYMIGPANPMRGDEVVLEMRSRGCKSLIVGVSASDVEKALLDAGADCFISKPLDPQTFLPTMDEAIAKRALARVLVVDDSRVNCTIMARRMKKLLPYATVETAASGEEALAICGSQAFGLVLLDEHMGSGMKGSEVAHHLRERFPTAILISVSGLASSELDSTHAFDLFWQKPLSNDDELLENMIAVSTRKFKQESLTAVRIDVA